MQMTKLVFVGGVHGVGKTTFCKSLVAKIGYEHVTASQLIKEQRATAISSTKEVADIADNQKLLLTALAQRRESGGVLLLDGHFTLITQTGDIQEIDKQVFANIAPNAIIMLHDTPEAIAARLMQRDDVTISIDSISHRQAKEITHGQAIAAYLGIVIYEVTPTEYALEKLESTLNGN
jgi:adenylate kinase